MFTKEHLGYLMKDKTSGFTGVAIGYEERMHNVPRFVLAPRAEDPSKLPDSWSFDVILLEIVSHDDRKVVESLLPVDHPFNLGEEVEDSVSGLSGTIVTFTTHLSGCVSAKIIERQKKTDGAVNQIEVPVQRLTSKKKKEKPAPAMTGGPPERFIR